MDQFTIGTLVGRQDQSGFYHLITIPKMKKVKHFFWLCSGANISLLERCPTESSKYAGIGATIFFTGLFAALAGGYALFTVFENYASAAGFGIIWGLMIFNLDRYIVSSMRKKGNIKKEFYTAIPRIILAVLISLVIAKPLEMKIFEKEINTELDFMEKKAFTEKSEIVQVRYKNEQQQLKSENEKLKLEIEQKTIKRDELRTIAQQEADGTGGSMKRNAGPIYQIKNTDADRVNAELELMQNQNYTLIAANYSKLNEIDSLITNEVQAIQRGNMDGPAARMDALSHITSNSQAIWIANWFIMLLFIAVESAPVFVKLISPRGPYDHLLLVEERSIETAMYESIAIQNADIKQRSTSFPKTEKKYIDNKLESSLK